MISQSGYPRERFYAASKKTAKKIGVSPAKEMAD